MELDGWVKDVILSQYKMQVDSLINYQSKEGLWHTLIDHEDSYLEVSGSSGFTYGILKGIRAGYLTEEYKTYASKAVAGILSHINEEGVVGQVSYGTILADTLDYYKNVSLKSTGYGQNLTLMMLVELLCWEKEECSLPL